MGFLVAQTTYIEPQVEFVETGGPYGENTGACQLVGVTEQPDGGDRQAFCRLNS
jgi:hypothetical protein